MGPRQQHHKNGNSTSRRWPTTKRNVRVIALRHVHSVSQVQALTKHSVYVRNLEERIKPGELIDALKELFSEYGEIIDVVAKTNLKAKGQAFVVFDNVESAQKCIEDVQGFDLFGKPMQLAFAKTRSDAFVKRTAGDEELESHKRRRLAEKDKKKAAEQAEEQKRLKHTAPAGMAPDGAQDLSKLPVVLVSSLQMLVPLLSSPTSTCLPIRFSSCRTYQRTTISML